MILLLPAKTASIVEWVNNLSDVLLIVDEAHHATAKTYRKVINVLKERGNASIFRMLRLKATPFRTAESEQGLRIKVFPNDILFKENLRNLIMQGILAKPIFEELPTKLEIYRELNPREVKTIQDIDTLPRDIAQKITESSLRNNRIVEHYIQNQEEYKQLVVFAIGIIHALALNTLFNDKKLNQNTYYLISKTQLQVLQFLLQRKT